MKCIYKIRNLINNKIYIGSTKNFNKRKLRHIQCLKNNYHHNIHLQRSHNKYGIKNFVFEVIEECSEEALFKKEKFWIEKLNPEYNIGAVGGGDNYTNHPNKDIFYERLCKQLKECIRPKLLKNSNPNWKGGKTFFMCPVCNKETRIGGDKVIPSTCAKCRNRNKEKNPFYGKSHSEETKKLLREQRIGITNLHSSKRCSINGIEYQSCTQAAQSLKIKQATLSNRIRSKSKRFENYYYL